MRYTHMKTMTNHWCRTNDTPIQATMDSADKEAQDFNSPSIDANGQLNMDHLQSQSAQQLQEAQLQMLTAFWNNQISSVEKSDPDFKTHALPLARIKKVMKSDEDVRNLLTLRAWMHAEESKRRTLQKSDVALAVARSDQYDFLIDIVPRDLDPMRPSPKSRSSDDAYFSNPNSIQSPFPNQDQIFNYPL
ncbi:hypothetical protein HK096_008415, partial [Nowakowskiella sp. JEL0078]